MAAVRVFLLTCRRPHLLPRALASLRAQTFGDWICELHNDDPNDCSPARILEAVADSRITLHQHATNWGPVAVFNHAFAAGPEPFATILEDDNWWDPTFLADAYAALCSTPSANVVWANLRIWLEQHDGSWLDTGRSVWQTAPGNLRPILFNWPQPIQLSDALHSNGAMLFRATVSAAALVPSDTPVAIIEPVRERLMPGGWLFLPQALGNFAQTLRTARSDDRASWAQCQLLVAASYVAAVRPDRAILRSIWATLRAQHPPSTPLLFHLGLAGFQSRSILCHATICEWMRFIVGSIRHPHVLIRALCFRRHYAGLWQTLRAAAEARSAETLRRTEHDTTAVQLLTKRIPA